MNTKKTIYLASPYGFSEIKRKLVLPVLVEMLERIGLEVWEPFERNNQHKDSPNAGYLIGQADKKDTMEADAIFAVVNGVPPDEGVMVELGIAIALGKPTFLFHDDFRRASDTQEYPLNLMLFTGLPEDNWQDYYYQSIDEIYNSEKALMKWINNKL